MRPNAIPDMFFAELLERALSYYFNLDYTPL